MLKVLMRLPKNNSSRKELIAATIFDFNVFKKAGGGSQESMGNFLTLIWTNQSYFEHSGFVEMVHCS